MPTPGATTGNYFAANVQQMKVHGVIFEDLGKAIADRKFIYNRATFYSDVALVLRKLLELRQKPFITHHWAWEWWIDELEGRAKELGKDLGFSMHLPPPWAGNAAGWQLMFSRLDLLWRYLPTIYRQEADDSQSSRFFGDITPGEAVKITKMFAIWLEDFCYDVGDVEGLPFMKTTWPWLEAVVSELTEIHKQLGEGSTAGGPGSSGGPIPPISWPEMT